jgi:hypothetical protein
MAHYRFGQEVLLRLDEKTRSAALAFKPEFDAGLQGPDVFFFFRPYRRNRMTDYGRARHNEPAVNMFAPLLEKVHEKAALSCLLGLICHYALDKLCHPYIIKNSAAHGDHQRMESAFDLHIMLTNSFSKARFSYLPSGGLDYDAMASLWPGIKADTVRKCLRAERRAIRVLDRRSFLEACEKAVRKPGALTPMTLPGCVSEAQREHVRELSVLYEKALEECPDLIRTALDAMGSNNPRLPGFELSYKGAGG